MMNEATIDAALRALRREWSRIDRQIRRLEQTETDEKRTEAAVLSLVASRRCRDRELSR